MRLQEGQKCKDAFVTGIFKQRHSKPQGHGRDLGILDEQEGGGLPATLQSSSHNTY